LSFCDISIGKFVTVISFQKLLIVRNDSL